GDRRPTGSLHSVKKKNNSSMTSGSFETAADRGRWATSDKGRVATAFFAATAAVGLLAVMASPRALADTSLVAAYNLYRGSGFTLTDQSGNSHSGTLVNGPAWSGGKYGGGLALDGVNDYVS